MRKAMARASRAVDKVCRLAASGFFGIMLILVLFQVVSRYIFRGVPVWTEEAARYAMVWGGLLGASSAFRLDADPRLIQPPKNGPAWWSFLAFWARAGATVVFLGPVLYHADKFLIRTYARTSDALGIPLAFVTVAVPLFVAVIFFHLLVRIVTHRAGLGEPEEEP